MDTNISDRFSVLYGIQAHDEDEAKKIAFTIQVEQTIEFPYELLRSSWLRDTIVGRLESLYKVGCNQYEALISYASDLGANEVTQVLNVVFGNSSLQPGIWVKDIQLSPNLWKLFRGPRFGLEGIRKLIGVPYRSLLQAVLKPTGSTVSDLAYMCKAYTRGGVDVIKDDHGITNQRYTPFEERIKACVEAVNEGRVHSYHNTLYAVNVSGDGSQTIERAYKAKELGADAIMVAPAMVGFGMMHQLACDENLKMPIISHPAFSGGFTMEGLSGISMRVWFGFLNRICGADMPIFVSYGGRFTFSKESCVDIIETCLDKKFPIKPACPSPGGGVTEERLPELIEAYGRHVMYLVGGDMFRRGPDIEENSRVFIDLLEKKTGNNKNLLKGS